MADAYTSGGMSDDPGAPESTDPEATSAETAEAAEAEAEEAAAEAAVDPEADAEVNEVLDGSVPHDLRAAEDAQDDAVDLDGVGGQDVDPVRAELDERTADLQRVTAEYANYRRRVDRDRKAVVEGARADVVSSLLGILDDLQLAESHGDLDGPLKSVSDKLTSALTGLGLEAFAQEGDGFDPALHEAVQDTSSGDEKVIGTVLRKGYRLGDRTLRHALVVIADPA
ncbi:nucleotide exchange factor GrpE [Corynebacterium bovis]|uniref:nucleotide exchange factor GrpE n=1 Tax=Corynebacterium bovis TaxID=36808 RepID=UPI00244A2FA7|nr:nucleotide exchange factor GrpE [Corynebacterium bovis]MDH2456378.1 nucleotide exchange factor GrpE [Corynebacterium bovis]